MATDDWPYSTGKNATRDTPSSRVRVYDRSDLPGRIFMTRAWVKTESGRPVEVALPEGMTRERARLLADETSTQRQIAILEGRTASGEKKPVTVRELLDKYHAWLESQDRSPKTMDDKDRCRKFWLAASAQTKVTALTTADVTRIAAMARKRGGYTTRWDRKRLAYLRAAVRWGFNEARLYDTYPLRGLKLPEYNPDTQALVYDATEAILLATPHPDIDWRVTLAASIICDTGRRISAVLAIAWERDLVMVDDRLHIVFRREHDKGRRTSTVAVSGDTQLLIAEALERTDVIESGWLFPEGRLEYVDPIDKPFNKDAATTSLHDAERVLGIEYIPGRAWHGLKRAHVTASWEEAGGDAGLVGDVTGNVDANLLRNTYRQLNRKRTSDHVDRVRRRFKEEADDGS